MRTRRHPTRKARVEGVPGKVALRAPGRPSGFSGESTGGLRQSMKSARGRSLAAARLMATRELCSRPSPCRLTFTNLQSMRRSTALCEAVEFRLHGDVHDSFDHLSAKSRVVAREYRGLHGSMAAEDIARRDARDCGTCLVERRQAALALRLTRNFFAPFDHHRASVRNLGRRCTS